MKKLIELKNINKSYRNGDQELQVLKDISLEVEEGEFVAIMGPSGSGKSTLMNIIGMLDRPTTGEYHLGSEEVAKLGDKKLAKVRNKQIGFVFQQFNLIDTINVYQNIEVPLIYAGVKDKNKRKELIYEKLNQVGLSDKALSSPNHLSGGQKQRIAIARAIVNSPKIIFADEPTGALDSETGRDIMELLSSLNKNGTTVIMVTHDQDMTKYASRVITLKDGAFVKEV